jgi:hypothetical protein
MEGAGYALLFADLAGSKQMKGTFKLIINKETILQALTYWINEHVFNNFVSKSYLQVTDIEIDIKEDYWILTIDSGQD